MLLAVMCGLRRGEILALRWRHVELGDNRRMLSIRESAEQTKDKVRYKERRRIAHSGAVVDDAERAEGSPDETSGRAFENRHQARL
ncbi:hypothetical protein [Rhizobium sp. ZPR3]|uniref:Tyr recombinase domain-containing protein n=2 Tax=unclassified Rhizobium TaxID=2613769 RepID=A0AAU7SFL9_9HYPH